MLTRRLLRGAVFLAVVALAAFPRIEWLELANADTTQLKRAQERLSVRGLRFRFRMQALGRTEDGTRACWMRYKAEDGIEAERAVYFFDTPAEAAAERDRIIARSRILETRSMLNFEGKQQERVVLITPSYDDPLAASVVWTNGDDLWVLESASLFHVLAFEQWGFTPKPPPTASSQASNHP